MQIVEPGRSLNTEQPHTHKRTKGWDFPGGFVVYYSVKTVKKQTMGTFTTVAVTLFYFVI